ncbi:hypothetical protein QFC20_002884 [Naganishia adeliensis]|uniref:Uncharacterized protein n=1 Tax=Naganishia adeliensis TaxID=92952 RepID=A0ACC2WGU7_9TREE|nr:hypothetical protein QFC20_002884 [Naganishia adeliensis]
MTGAGMDVLGGNVMEQKRNYDAAFPDPDDTVVDERRHSPGARENIDRQPLSDNSRHNSPSSRRISKRPNLRHDVGPESTLRLARIDGQVSKPNRILAKETQSDEEDQETQETIPLDLDDVKDEPMGADQRWTVPRPATTSRPLGMPKFEKKPLLAAKARTDDARKDVNRTTRMINLHDKTDFVPLFSPDTDTASMKLRQSCFERRAVLRPGSKPPTLIRGECWQECCRQGVRTARGVREDGGWQAEETGLDRDSAVGGSTKAKQTNVEKYEINPERNHGLNYAYHEVERRKEERKKLAGHGCIECENYYNAVGEMPVVSRVPIWRSPSPKASVERLAWHRDNVRMEDMLKGVTELGTRRKDDGDTTTEEGKHRAKNQISRHREDWTAPSTPPMYWNIGFPSTQDVAAINQEAVRQKGAKRAEMRREAEKKDGKYRRIAN